MKLSNIINKRFITFCIIGVINTLIHLLIYNLVIILFKTDALENFIEVIANTIAFIVASLFSYMANAYFTFKKKTSNYSFWFSMLSFLIKLILSDLLVILFKFILIKLSLESLIFLIPIPVTCILLPLQYIVFKYIFRNEKSIPQS
ncbi:MAG TPA: hypothetical protein GXZ48_04770 [Acholeplasmataceae bacterium]|nr:hypothetical protein [Acholeplasmataceae bacterium]